MAAKKIEELKVDPLPKTCKTKVTVGWNKKTSDGNYGSNGAEIWMETELEIDPQADPLGFRLECRKLFKQCRDTIHDELMPHSEVYLKCMPLMNEADSLEKLDGYAKLICERIKENKVHPWEIDELDYVRNLNQIRLTDYFKEKEKTDKQTEKTEPKKPDATQKELLENDVTETETKTDEWSA